MEALLSLFFELSNDTRMGILRALSDKPLRLTALSKELDMPAQEVSRQLSRLERVNVTRKDTEGFYNLTPYAGQLLRLLPSFSFLTDNRLYFTDHSMAWVPDEFVGRVGELEECQPNRDVMMSFHYVEEAIKRSRETIIIVSDQILMSTLPLLSDKVNQGVSFRIIVPKNFELASPVRTFFLSHNEASPTESWENSTRFVDHLGVAMTVSEREIGMLSFPSALGSFDYIGFRSENPEAIRWATDLFEYIWDRGSKKIPDQILRAYE